MVAPAELDNKIVFGTMSALWSFGHFKVRVLLRLRYGSFQDKACPPWCVALGNAIAFSPHSGYTSAVSLAEIKTAVETLSPDELTELTTFIRERDNAAWDLQIDSDFSDGGRLSSVAEEVRADIRVGFPFSD